MLLQRNPDEPGPNNDLGYLYAEQGKNLEKAEVDDPQGPARKSPTSFAYLDSLGWVLFKRGKLKEALEPLKKAAEQMKAEIERAGPARRHDPRASGRRVLPAPSSSTRRRRLAAGRQGRAGRPARQAMAEIRKKLESLEKLGPMPKPSSSRTP